MWVQYSIKEPGRIVAELSNDRIVYLMTTLNAQTKQSTFVWRGPKCIEGYSKRTRKQTVILEWHD